jgi:putative SOS response-associated peptidase YedK
MREVEHRCSLDDPPRLTALSSLYTHLVRHGHAARIQLAKSSRRSNQDRLLDHQRPRRGVDTKPAFREAFRQRRYLVPWTVFTNGRKPRSASGPMRLR